MRTYRVTFSPGAEDNLASIYEYVLLGSGQARADDVLDQLVEACRRLEHFPRRGVPRDDLRPGVRMISYRRWASIVFAVEQDAVSILQVVWRGQDLAAALNRSG